MYGTMETSHSPSSKAQGTREHLIDAAIRSVRVKGYASTSIDDLCRACEVTKGAFFHHFRSKEDMAIAAAATWSSVAETLFSEAPFQKHPDPVDRILGYLDLRRSMITGSPEEISCFAGTCLQEVFSSNESLRAACGDVILDHAAMLRAHIEDAMSLHGGEFRWTALSLALHIQAVLQGAFIIAKATADVSSAIDCIDHLRSYIELLFNHRATGGN